MWLVSLVAGGGRGATGSVAAVVDAWVLIGCRPACCGCSRQCARRDEARSVGRLRGDSIQALGLEEWRCG